MSHIDSPAWKHQDEIYPDFALEIRNIRLCLSTYEFQPFGQSGQQYSSCLVILTPNNLLSWICMKEQHILLTIWVLGPHNLKDKINGYLQPLISKLINIWEVGMHTHDVSLNQNFQLRTVLFWTINDYPTYSLLSGWSTTVGKIACMYTLYGRPWCI